MPAFPSNALEGHYRGHILLELRIIWGSIEGLGWLWRWRSETKDAELGESYFVSAPLKCGETRGMALVCHLPITGHLLFTLLYTKFSKGLELRRLALSCIT